MTETEKSLFYVSFSDRKLGNYIALLHSLLEVKLAAARANFFSGHFNFEVFERLERAFRELKQFIQTGSDEKILERFPVDMLSGGGSISIHMNVLEVIATQSGLPIKIINLSQSTADVLHTSFRIAAFRESQLLVEVLRNLISTIDSQCYKWTSITKLSRTCLQDAICVNLGNSWKGYSTSLNRRLQAIEQESLNLLKINLGGTVVGSGEGATTPYRDRVIQELMQVTDLPLSRSENLYDSAQNSDDLASFHSCISLLAQVLMKFARDVRLLSSGPKGGLGEFHLPQVQNSSSFFSSISSKVNPILPETLLQCGFKILGAEYSLQIALQNSELDLNVFDGFMGSTLLDSLRLLTPCCDKFNKFCISDLEPDLKRHEELSRFQQTFNHQKE